MRFRGGSKLANAVYAAFAVLILYSMFPAVSVADMSEEEKSFLSMYFTDEELQVVTSTRSIKSISRVAENMTVVTAADIERMNAHTLADVLNTVNGVQVHFAGATPGNLAQVSIQGSDSRHVTVLIDGVALNNLSDNTVDIGMIPVQSIQKIEIVKGPASSAWGSALGGVINIITKSPDSKGVHGVISASYGSESTGDLRVEMSGRTGDAGLYLTAGKLRSDGLRPFTDFNGNNLYGKFTFDLSSATNMVLTASYVKANSGEGDLSLIDLFEKTRFEHYFATLSLNSRLSDEIDLNVMAKVQRQQDSFDGNFLDTGDPESSRFDDRRVGGSAKLTWRHGDHTVVFGSDYDDGTLKSVTILNGKQDLKRWAVFANDSIVIGKFTITPGLRYDNTNLNGDFISPSLGATYQLTGRTIIRADVARGFNIPFISASVGNGVNSLPNPDLRVEKVWSYQAGVESGELKYVWIKVSLFRHDLRDAIMAQGVNDTLIKYVNEAKQRRQGFEAEIRTIPVYNTSLSAGTTFVDARNPDTDEVQKDVPRYTYDIALTYDDRRSFNAVMKGHYIWWNEPDFLNAKYSAFIFDLSMTKNIFRKADTALQVFLTAHNLFNGSQYWIKGFENARRWAEVGVRYKF